MLVPSTMKLSTSPEVGRQALDGDHLDLGQAGSNLEPVHGDAVGVGGAVDDHRVAGRGRAAVDVDGDVHGRIGQVDDDHVIIILGVDIDD